jgi:acetyl esterase/lipase
LHAPRKTARPQLCDRADDLLESRAQLVKQRVDVDLHVWEGMFHGFFYNVDVPEARDCYDVIVKFFGRQLGSK